MLLSGGRPGRTVHPIEGAQWSSELETALEAWSPDVLYTYSYSPLNQEALRPGAPARHPHSVQRTQSWIRASRLVRRRRLRGGGSSPFLARHYRETIGLNSIAIDSPIVWADVLAPEGHRAFVTFVNPLATKGAAVFARIAEILSQERPDIPLLVVPSVAGPSGVQAFSIDLTRYPDIMVTPPVTRPKDFFELTKILLVPSVIPEAFGRVAAEAMINGIPALVSNRGGLPETVEEGGFVIAVPDDVTDQTREAPAAEVVRPWVETIYRLWDDEGEYARARFAARAVGDRKYREASQKARYAEVIDQSPGGCRSASRPCPRSRCPADENLPHEGYCPGAVPHPLRIFRSRQKLEPQDRTSGQWRRPCSCFSLTTASCGLRPAWRPDAGQ